MTTVSYAALLGPDSGHSLVDLLYSDVSLSAAPTYTSAITEDDYHARPCEEITCNFAEGK